MILERLDRAKEIEALFLKDRLSEITADLVTYKPNNRFIERLFSCQVGQWAEVTALSQGMDAIAPQLAQVQALCPGKLKASWLEYPNAAAGRGDCLIVFSLQALHWSRLTLYNRQLFWNQNSTL